MRDRRLKTSRFLRWFARLHLRTWLALSVVVCLGAVAQLLEYPVWPAEQGVQVSAYGWPVTYFNESVSAGSAATEQNYGGLAVNLLAWLILLLFAGIIFERWNLHPLTTSLLAVLGPPVVVLAVGSGSAYDPVRGWPFAYDLLQLPEYSLAAAVGNLAIATLILGLVACGVERLSRQRLTIRTLLLLTACAAAGLAFAKYEPYRAHCFVSTLVLLLPLSFSFWLIWLVCCETSGRATQAKYARPASRPAV